MVSIREEKKELSTMAKEIGSAEQETAMLVTRTLALWIVRWVIGFTLIAITVSFRPDWAWLWWAGLAVAAASLAFTLAMHALLQRKMDSALNSLAQLEAALAETEDDT